MKRISAILFLSLMMGVFLGSCEKESGRMLQEPSSLVPVSLSLSTASEWDGDGRTRAFSLEEIGSTDIRTLCILQYDGTTEDAPLAGSPIYWASDSDTAPVSVRLHDSNSHIHTIVFLANTFASIRPYPTLGQLKKAYRTLDGADDIWGRTDNGGGYPGDPAQYYHRLHGLAVAEVTEGAEIPVKFHRSMVRIHAHISNDGTDGLSIQSVQLCNVSQKDYYLTDYSYLTDGSDINPTLFDGPFQDEFSRHEPLRTDYSEEAWTGLSNGEGEADYLWYIPANIRGTSEGNWDSNRKNQSPLAEGATYLRIRANDADGQIYLYFFYLGANLKNDFSLVPNTAYDYQFRFSGHGSYSDARVHMLSDIDFNVDANCYILNSSPFSPRSYTFNAIHRPNIFWGDRYGLNADYPNYRIDQTKQWKAKIIWSDFAMTQAEAQAFLSRREGTGEGDYYSDSQRIKVTVPQGFEGGNVLVGMYIDDPSNILWSWHLWITDYQPDAIAGQPPVPGEYLYRVPGGEVHRYAGASWQSGGRYEKGYAMDRNLGALDAVWHDTEQSRGGGMSYQFGRKDPLPGFHTLWIFDENGNSSSKGVYRGSQNGNNIERAYGSTLNEQTGGANVPYSVNHPMTVISWFDWTQDPVFYPGWYSVINLAPLLIWNDPKSSEHGDFEETGGNSDKSLFDPCPPGWRVPAMRGGETGSWVAGFCGGNTPLDNPSINFVCNIETQNGYKRGYGYTYYPKGYASEQNNPAAQTVFFPFCYYRSASSGYFDYSGANATGKYWCDTMYNIPNYLGISNSYNAEPINYATASTWVGTTRDMLSVRCVKQ